MKKIVIGLMIGCAISALIGVALRKAHNDTVAEETGKYQKSFPELVRKTTSPDAVKLNAGDALGRAEGLGSDDFVVSAKTFEFSPDLAVEVRFYKYEYPTATHQDPKWELLEGPIYMAYDPEVGKGGVNISAIRLNKHWRTMYGGHGGYELETFNRGKKMHLMICPTEQGCFQFRVNKDQERKFRNQLNELNRKWVEVGKEGLSKRTVTKSEVSEEQVSKSTFDDRLLDPPSNVPPYNGILVKWLVRPQMAIRTSLSLKGGGKENKMVCKDRRCIVTFPVKQGDSFKVVVTVDTKEYSLPFGTWPAIIELSFDDGSVTPRIRIWRSVSASPANFLMEQK